MSSYTKIEINTDKVELTNDVIKTLENLTGSFWYGFEDCKQIISKNHLEYYKAFNHDFEKAISLLKLIEKYSVHSDIVEKIGELDSEDYFGDSDRDIFLYKGKIYMVYSRYDRWGDTYFVSDLNLSSKTIEDEKFSMVQIIEKYLVENSSSS
uniref:Uncharacterized protein n=1 Tax=Clostridium botulinum TaxID=1491 RepID=A0A140B460_CLOBO|nr:hypothetical protein [Clostridium botulinum]ALP69025.1 UBA_EF-Ts domain containing hypothetical protein [Clostridium botulinum]